MSGKPPPAKTTPPKKPAAPGAPKPKAKKPSAPAPPKPKVPPAVKAQAKATAKSSGTKAISAQQLQQLKAKFDIDGDKSYTFAEFKELAGSIAKFQGQPAIKDEDLKVVFEDFDKDDSGQLSSKEFDWAYATLQQNIQEQAATKIQAVFRGGQARTAAAAKAGAPSPSKPKAGAPSKPKAPSPPKPKAAASKAKAKAKAPTAGTASLSPAQLRILRDKFDKDKDQKLGFSEFVELSEKIAQIQGKPFDNAKQYLKDVFDQFDQDGSGTMSFEEFDWAFATLEETITEAARISRGEAKAKAKAQAPKAGTASLSPSQLKLLRDKFDVNKDQKISFDEFVGLSEKIAEIQAKPFDNAKQHLKEVFDQFDQDGSGTMSFEEFDWAFATLEECVREAAAVSRGEAKAKAKSVAKSSGTAALNQGQMNALRQRYDIDDDQLLSLAEFKGLSRKVAELLNKSAPPNWVLEDIFDSFDKDYTGTISMDEFNWAYATILERIEAAPDTPAKDKVPGFYTARLDRSQGEKLGLAVDQETFLITQLTPGGLAAKWNQANPQNRIRPGDSIAKVNNKPGLQGLNSEMLNPDVKVLSIELAPLSRLEGTDDDDISDVSSVVSDEAEALQRYKETIAAVQELDEKEKQRRERAERKKIKALKEGEKVLPKISPKEGSFYRQLAGAFLPGDLAAQAEDERRQQLQREQTRRYEERQARLHDPGPYIQGPPSHPGATPGRSTFACPCCSRLFHVFKEGTRHFAVVAHGVELLGQSPELLSPPGPPAAIAKSPATPLAPPPKSSAQGPAQAQAAPRVVRVQQPQKAASDSGSSQSSPRTPSAAASNVSPKPGPPPPQGKGFI
eukprot:TRINITY_DN12184_c0_g1_i1.p1 TRINITY_DN12184_c0_g1~~TRINITY_DN12184_c0_g1_i1.p1  ORF type:complete len:846 (+),score=209.82 TRINITY_DN12184_c0_g1_i1:207-2744(+)